MASWSEDRLEVPSPFYISYSHISHEVFVFSKTKKKALDVLFIFPYWDGNVTCFIKKRYLTKKIRCRLDALKSHSRI